MTVQNTNQSTATIRIQIFKTNVDIEKSNLSTIKFHTPNQILDDVKRFGNLRFQNVYLFEKMDLTLKKFIGTTL